MINEKIKKSFLVISSPPFGGKHSTVQYSYSNFDKLSFAVQYTIVIYRKNITNVMF